MSLISRLRAVVAGDDYLETDFDDLDYEAGDEFDPSNRGEKNTGSELAPFSQSSPFDIGSSASSSNVIGMPGISTTNSEVNLMEPRSFDEMPRAIQALRERKIVILNLTMMEPDQAQRAVDFVAGGTFAIDGHQERIGESIFLFAPGCVSVTNTYQEEVSSPTVVNKTSDVVVTKEPSPAPTPEWGESIASAI